MYFDVLDRARRALLDELDQAIADAGLDDRTAERVRDKLTTLLDDLLSELETIDSRAHARPISEFLCARAWPLVAARIAEITVEASTLDRSAARRLGDFIEDRAC